MLRSGSGPSSSGGGAWGDECLNSVQPPHHPPRALGAGDQATLCGAVASHGKEGAGPDPGWTGGYLQLPLPDAHPLAPTGSHSESVLRVEVRAIYFSLMSTFYCLQWC